MRIVVCVKQVPEVSELGLDPVTKRLRRDGVPLQINPFDRRAVLEAMRLKGELGGTVTVLSMGPPQAGDALRECLSLGADRAVLLCDPSFAGADTLATARTLARAIEAMGYDLVLAGRFSIDSETGQVGPEIAALLDAPLLSGVRRLAVAPGDGAGFWTAAAECERDDGFADVTCETPLVVTCTDRWKTRVPLVMPDEEAAAKRPLETWTAATLGGEPADYGQQGSPTWVADVQAVATDRRREVRVVEDGIEDAIDAVLAEVAAARTSESRAGRSQATHPRPDATRDAVWVVAELGLDGRPRAVTAELLGAADRLAGVLGVGVIAIPVASELPSEHRSPLSEKDLADDLGALGADVLLVPAATDACTEIGLARSLEEAIRAHAPRIVLAPATGLGRDLVPRVAARLGLGLTGDAIGVELDAEGRLLQLKPAFGGQFVAPILSRTRPEMATLRPGVLTPVSRSELRGAARIAHLPANAARGAARVRTVGWTSEIAEGTALDEASVVVCVGYGLGKDGVDLARQLAAALGGVVGATRRVCDVGWLPRQLQIGISGRSVAPALYVAVGVRGSFNHMVGMQRATRVVAINRDPQAEVFAGADLGIVGDAPAFVSALLARLGAART